MTPISTRLRELEENLRGDHYLYGISEQDWDTHANVMNKHFSKLASIRAEVEALAKEMRYGDYKWDCNAKDWAARLSPEGE